MGAAGRWSVDDPRAASNGARKDVQPGRCFCALCLLRIVLDVEFLSSALHVWPQPRSHSLDQGGAIYAAALWIETNRQLHGEQLPATRFVRILCICAPASGRDSLVRQRVEI